jgi:hypothetical protein
MQGVVRADPPTGTLKRNALPGDRRIANAVRRSRRLTEQQRKE